MLKNVIGSIGAAAHRLVSNWRASLIFLVLYLAMLLAVYMFLVTGVATVGELVILGVTVAIAPVIFFVIQAMGIGYMADESGAGRLLAKSLKGFWKLVIITIPFILLAWLLVYLIGKIPAGTAVAHEAVRAAASPGRTAAHPAPQPIDWRGVGLAALQFLLLGIALPLAAINLWIAALRDGLGHAVRGAHRVLHRSFAPGAMLIYLVGLLIFGVVPYLLVELRPPLKGEWIEVGQLGFQLALAALLSLFGWVLTLGALTRRQRSEPVMASSK
jgi:hypothetical protein